jgi:hypothetical protein
VLLHLVIVPGSQYHPSHLQCFCCCCIPPGCEGREDAGEAGHAQHTGRCRALQPGGQLCQSRAWHTPPTLEAEKAGKPNAGAAAQGGGKNNNNNNSNNKKKNKRASGNNQPLASAHTAAAAPAAAGGGHGLRNDKHPREAFDSNDGGAWCPVHNSTHHNAGECRDIKKLAEQFCER